MEPHMAKHLLSSALSFLFLFANFLYILYHNFYRKSKFISPIPTNTRELYDIHYSDKLHHTASNVDAHACWFSF